MNTKEKKPSNNIQFGTSVALIPAIPDVLDNALWVHTYKHNSFGKLYFKQGEWIQKNKKLCSFSIYKHPNCIWCDWMSILTHGKATLSLRSPVNGLLIKSYGAFGDNFQADFPQEAENMRGMAAILLPFNEIVQETFGKAGEELTKLILQYRKALFHNKDFLNRIDDKEIAKKVLSDKWVNNLVNNFARQKIVIKQITDTPFTTNIEHLRETFRDNMWNVN